MFDTNRKSKVKWPHSWSHGQHREHAQHILTTVRLQRRCSGDIVDFMASKWHSPNFQSGPFTPQSL